MGTHPRMSSLSRHCRCARPETNARQEMVSVQFRRHSPAEGPGAHMPDEVCANKLCLERRNPCSPSPVVVKGSQPYLKPASPQCSTCSCRCSHHQMDRLGTCTGPGSDEHESCCARPIPKLQHKRAPAGTAHGPFPVPASFKGLAECVEPSMCVYVWNGVANVWQPCPLPDQVAGALRRIFSPFAGHIHCRKLCSQNMSAY